MIPTKILKELFEKDMKEWEENLGEPISEDDKKLAWMDLLDASEEFRDLYVFLIEKIENMIKEHENCTEYHELNGEKATCLDVVLERIKELRGDVDG